MSSSEATASRERDAVLVQIGHETLRILAAREQAAKYEAARLELQNILASATGGRTDRLRRWLSDHADVVNADAFPEIAEMLQNAGVEQAPFAFPTSGVVPAPHLPPIAGTPMQISSGPLDGRFRSDVPLADAAHAATKPPSEQKPPGDATSSAAARPDNAQKSSPDDVAAAKSDPVNKEQLAAKSGKVNEVNKEESAAKADKAKKPHLSNTASTSVPKTAAKAAVKFARAESSAGVSASQTAALSSALTVPVRPGDLRSSPAVRKRNLKWLGGGMGVSLLLHVVLTVGLGLAVYTISHPTHPVDIVSTPFEAIEPVSAPVEMPAPLEMEVSELNESMPAPDIATVVEVPAISSSLDTVAVDATAELLNGTLASMMSTAAAAVGPGGQGFGGTGNMPGVSFFGVNAAGNTFCFVVDCSGSMRRNNAFEAAKAELLKAIGLLKPTQRFFVSFFGEEVFTMKLDGVQEAEYPVYATPENIAALAKWVQGVPIIRGRPPNDALDEAISKDPDAIFMLFDGETTVDVAAHLRKENREVDIVNGEQVKVPINVVCFYSDEGAIKMKQVAEENAGTFRFIPAPSR